MTQIVMFRGQQCWINGIFSAGLVTDEIQDGQLTILFELIAVESASVTGTYKGSMAPMGSFAFLPSSIDFENSEWSVGVSNGKAK